MIGMTAVHEINPIVGALLLFELMASLEKFLLFFGIGFTGDRFGFLVHKPQTMKQMSQSFGRIFYAVAFSDMRNDCFGVGVNDLSQVLL